MSHFMFSVAREPSLQGRGSRLGGGVRLQEGWVPASAGMTGGVGGGWGDNHVVLLLCGHPPRILRRAQHERPRPWGWLHAMGGSSRGGCSTFSAGRWDGRGVGSGWGSNDAGSVLRGHPPRILRRAQHERPRPWGWLHAMGGSSRGGCSTFSAGRWDDRGVGDDDENRHCGGRMGRGRKGVEG